MILVKHIILIFALYVLLKKLYKYSCINMQRKLIFPVFMSQMSLNMNLRKEPYYNQIIKAAPRKLTRTELIYLLKYKKFMELPDVYSMCEKPEVDQTYAVLKEIINNNIQGDLVEMGVWRGGTAMWMQVILKYYDVKKTIWMFDMFGSFPEPTHKKDKYIYDITELLFEHPPRVNDVIENFKSIGLYDDNLRFVVGEFEKTVPKTNISCIALLRCDADHYDSTKIILESYYFKISSGGYIIIDDYNNEFVGCKEAVDEFRSEYNITEEIHDTHGGSVYWRVS